MIEKKKKHRNTKHVFFQEAQKALKWKIVVKSEALWGWALREFIQTVHTQLFEGLIDESHTSDTSLSNGHMACVDLILEHTGHAFKVFAEGIAKKWPACWAWSR